MESDSHVHRSFRVRRNSFCEHSTGLVRKIHALSKKWQNCAMTCLWDDLQMVESVLVAIELVAGGHVTGDGAGWRR